MDETRPNPEKLLNHIETKIADSKRGKLKIFFGYAAGVGKTYSMLQAAQDAKKANIDVVVGYVEPHTRPETIKLLDGLEMLPTLDITHNGIVLHEFDLDAAIKRNPTLVLVDELAHTNDALCRHKKRYKDIEELLQSGINVYTTVNVQHIESLNDIVASISGVFVRERIPDYVFDLANQVELVDIEPEDLIARLNHGKIYQEFQAKNALNNFFTKENLEALREIALRRTADKVNKVVENNRILSSKKDFFTTEHILVCLSSSPSNAKVIRAAARIADAFRGTFTALYVDEGNEDKFQKEDIGRLNSNIRLAEDLGAKIITVYGDDIPSQITEYAKTSGVSKIVLGRSNQRKRIIQTKSSFMERLTSLAPNLDIYIIPDTQSHYRKLNKSKKELKKISISDILKSILILIVTSLIGLWFYHLGFSDANIIMLYLLGVLYISSVTSGRVYSALSSLLSVFVFNYLFTVPRFTFNSYDPGYSVTFIIMLLASLLVSALTIRVKEQARLAARKAYRTQILLETSQKLQVAQTKKEIFEETAKQLILLLDRYIVIYPTNETSLLEPLEFKNEEDIDTQLYLNDNEKAVAQWVFKNNKHAGATTSTLPGSNCLYLALRGHDKVLAVVGIAMQNYDSIEIYVKSLLIAMLSECGLALEKVKINDAKNAIMLQAENEKLRSNLLRAISHDLRTPLTSISGNASILMNTPEAIGEEKKQIIYEDIYDDSMWLIQLVENLLSITRIDKGTMEIKKEAELIYEVFQEALQHINRMAKEYEIEIQIENDLLMAWMDSRLIIQVLINIVNNAIKYTPKGSKIILSAKQKDAMIYIEIADEGPGIPSHSKDKIFDMFYTLSNSIGDSQRNLGLGLSLCKSIIKAHDGEIGVRDNTPNGSIFYFTLKSKGVVIDE